MGSRLETSFRRLASPDWRKHLRPWRKRLANGVIRHLDRALIAEWDVDPFEDDVLTCTRECCNPDWSDPRDDEDYGDCGFDCYEDAGSQPKWARDAILDENGMNHNR